METSQSLDIKAAAHRIARKRRAPEWRGQAGMQPDIHASFDPISEGGRVHEGDKRWPMSLRRLRTKMPALGSMIDEPNVSTPERALMAAVLKEAVKEGDIDWLASDDESYLFSAVNVCSVLGLDLAYLRRIVR